MGNDKIEKTDVPPEEGDKSKEVNDEKNLDTPEEGMEESKTEDVDSDTNATLKVTFKSQESVVDEEEEEIPEEIEKVEDNEEEEEEEENEIPNVNNLSPTSVEDITKP